MRTQTARLIELDDAAWQLPRVDPTGWLAGGPTAASRPGAPADPTPGLPAPTGAAGSVRPRRPRRTAEARVARDLELARRRRQRRGRAGLRHRPGHVAAIDPVAGSMSGPVAGAGIGNALRIEPAAPDGWVAGAAGDRRSGVPSGRRLVRPATEEGYRIGRWERLALTVLVGATLVLLAVRLVGALTAGPDASVDVTVKPGDTLWSIATAAAPDRDPRAVIDQIRELNQVTGDLVRAGEVLRVPASPDQGSAG